jgi:hypothetical protein
MKFANPVNPRQQIVQTTSDLLSDFWSRCRQTQIELFLRTIFRSEAALILRFFLGSGVLLVSTVAVCCFLGICVDIITVVQRAIACTGRWQMR